MCICVMRLLTSVCCASVLLGSASRRYDFASVCRATVFELGLEQGRAREIFSFPSPPNPSSRLSPTPWKKFYPLSASKIQDGGHSFREEIVSFYSKIRLIC